MIITFISLVSSKTDGTLDWYWSAVFWPLFLIDFILLSACLSQIPGKIQSEGTEEEQENGNQKKKLRLLATVVFLYYFCFSIFHVLVALKLDGINLSSWSTVFIPIFILETVNFVLIAIRLGVNARSPIFDSTDLSGTPRHMSSREFWNMAFDFYLFWILRIVQYSLLLAKLDIPIGFDSYSWAVVFIPVWAWGLIRGLQLSIEYYAVVKVSTKTEIKSQWIAKAVLFSTLALFLYTTAIMLLIRLINAQGFPRTVLILIPVFFLASLAFLCFCCCIPLMVCGAQAEMESKMKEGSFRVVPVSRRLKNAPEAALENIIITLSNE